MTKANRLLLLTAMRMEKLYQLRLFEGLFAKDALTSCDKKYRIAHSQYPCWVYPPPFSAQSGLFLVGAS
jgi:hypothetical protein